MGRLWDVACTVSDRLAEVREDVKALRRNLDARERSGCVDVEGLQRLIMREVPELEPVLMTLLELQVAIEHGSDMEVVSARRRLLEEVRRSKSGAGKFRIAPHRTTDVIKILSAMYDCRLFQTSDGLTAASKQEVMEEVGRLFQSDFSHYSTLLSKAKAASLNFLDIFDKLSRKAHDYYYGQ